MTNIKNTVVTELDDRTIIVEIKADIFTKNQHMLLTDILNGHIKADNGLMLTECVANSAHFELSWSTFIERARTLYASPEIVRSASAVFHTLNRKGVFSDIYKGFDVVIRTAPVTICDENTTTVVADDTFTNLDHNRCNDCGYTYASRGHTTLCG